MARQANDGRRVRPDQNQSIGAAVLDREETALHRLGVDKADLFELVPQPVVVMDRDHTILLLNQAAAQAAGKPSEACIGVKFWDLFDNPGCRAGTCAAAHAANTGKVCSGEALPVVQGKQTAVRVTAAPVFDDRRQVIGVVELIHPVEADLKASDEILRVSKDAKDGKLAGRVNPEGFEGRYRQLLEGVNDILDAVIKPLNVSAEYVDRISKGDIPPKITDSYNGDFNEIKNNLNACIDNILALVAETGMLIKASAEGRLTTRGDATKHQGDFRKIVEGVR